MPKKTITFQIEAETLLGIGKAFDAASEEAALKAGGRFAEIALQEFVDWITGATRHRSLTELYIQRVTEFYEHLLPKNEKPSLDRLYNSFNLPHGQAAYIVRVLNDRTLARWREQALKELAEALGQVEKATKNYVAGGEPQQRVMVRISKLAAIELRRIFERMWNIDKKLIQPLPAPGFGEIRAVEIPASTVIELLKHPELKFKQ